MNNINTKTKNKHESFHEIIYQITKSIIAEFQARNFNNQQLLLIIKKNI